MSKKINHKHVNDQQFALLRDINRSARQKDKTMQRIRLTLSSAEPTKSRKQTLFKNIYHYAMVTLLLIIIGVFTTLTAENRSSDLQEIAPLSNIETVLIAKAHTFDEHGFRSDVYRGKLGIIEMRDEFWGSFVAKAFSFKKQAELPQDILMAYDVAVLGNGERREIKVWFSEDAVYYSERSNETVFQMSISHAAYFKFVLHSIEDSLNN